MSEKMYDYQWCAAKRSTMAKEEESEESDTKKKSPFLAEPDSASRVTSKGRHIYYFAGVSKKSVYELNDYIIKLNTNFEDMQRKNPNIVMTPKPIYIHINSYGGGVFAAFAAVDFIKQSKIPIYTIIEGASASAATIMSVVGVKRYISPHASMLIHQLSSWFGGKMTEIEDEYQNLEQMMGSIKNIYSDHTKMTKGQLTKFLKHDVWWDAKKCIEMGLADEIWTGEEE